MGALHGRNDVPDSQALQCTRCSDAWAKMISGLGVVATRHPETFAVLGIAHFTVWGKLRKLKSSFWKFYALSLRPSRKPVPTAEN
jgi:hypothetical protein